MFTPKVAAFTDAPSDPLRTFFNPSAIGYNNSGRNLGNEGLIFHEALHGIAGLTDMQLMQLLQIDYNLEICEITVKIQSLVLSKAADLDKFDAFPCQ